jgi:hypothetical protein
MDNGQLHLSGQPWCPTYRSIKGGHIDQTPEINVLDAAVHFLDEAIHYCGDL